jgi:hypothetical protein
VLHADNTTWYSREYRALGLGFHGGDKLTSVSWREGVAERAERLGRALRAEVGLLITS